MVGRLNNNLKMTLPTTSQRKSYDLYHFFTPVSYVETLPLKCIGMEEYLSDNDSK
jgi:hypothetical protein